MTVLEAHSNSNSPSKPQFVEAPPPPPGDSAIDNADESDYLVMHCIVSGNPRPTISWSFNDQPLNVAADHVYIYENGTLALHLPEEEHEGTYKCESTNYLGVKSTVAIYRISGEFRIFSEKLLSKLKMI